MDIDDPEPQMFDFPETDSERAARIKREAAVIAAAEADIAAGNYRPWSEVKAELMARDRETFLKAGFDLAAGS
jgi:hypothetical protein